MVDSALAAVVTMDDQGRVTGWGARAQETFGWTQDEVMGKLLVDHIIPDRYRDRHTKGLERYRATGEGPVLGKVIELAALHKNGHEFPVELRISPAAQVAGSTMFIAYVADITERKRAQQAEAEALRKEAARIAELEETKTKFLNLAAHELRGPLTLMRGYVSMLVDGSVQQDQAGEVLTAQVERMNVLVNQLLDAARLDEGRLRLDVQQLELNALVSQCVERVTFLSGRSIGFEAGAGPVEVVGDRPRLETVIDNVLENATKYSEPGSPITCTVGTDAGLAVVSVTDRGHGIAEADLPLVFTRFGRIVTPDNSHIGGTGLGLYLSREIALMHGGDITVSSRLHHGSTFNLILPLNPLEDPEFAAVDSSLTGAAMRDDLAFDLRNFSQADMVLLASRLRKVALEGNPQESLAQRLVQELKNRLVEPSSGAPACALVRLYRTERFDRLDKELKARAGRMLGSATPHPALRCLKLVGSAGELPAWNDPRFSAHHRVFPLASPEMVADSPMVARLLHQLGVDLSRFLQPDFSMMLEPNRRAYSVFHIAQAKGSPYVPAQNEFVAAFGIESVLGFGGLLEDGELFAIILFSRVPIARRTAELFRGVAQSVRLSLGAGMATPKVQEEAAGSL